MRRKGAVLVSLLLAGTLILGACGKKGDTSSQGSSERTQIRLLNNKGEVVDQMQTLAEAYNSSQSAVEITIESCETGVDYPSLVKGYYLGDNMPDIIVCEASHFAKWEGLLADMSDQEWLKDTDSAYVDPTYGTLGFPYTTEAIGLAYNANILKKAGIDPAKLTSPKAYSDAFSKLDSMKGALGLKAVVAYSTDLDNLDWSTGNHIFGAYLDSGLARDDTTYIDMLNNDHKFDEKRLKHFAEFIGMLNHYSSPTLLTKGTQDDQIEGFASGKYAFMTQGSWTGASMTSAFAKEYKAAGNFEVGMAAYAFEDGMDTIMTSTPAWWAVTKEGHVKEAEDFLNWCANSEGQKILVEDAKFVSPFSSSEYIADDPFAQTISDHLASGKTSAWHWMDVAPGNSDRPAAPVFYKYAQGTYDANGFVAGMKSAFAAYFK